jgi:hypothetical protein
VYNADGTYQEAQLNMEQPFFPVRSITTSIQIYNGATVVMGGMITEVRVSHEDKIPFLGDLPLVGRLFRNSYESSEKRNLLIFVSARLVDPAGRFVRDTQDLTLMTEAAENNRSQNPEFSRPPIRQPADFPIGGLANWQTGASSAGESLCQERSHGSAFGWSSGEASLSRNRWSAPSAKAMSPSSSVQTLPLSPTWRASTSRWS